MPRPRRAKFEPLPATPGGFACIVADPPWQFRDRGSRIAPDQRRKRWGRKGYRTLSLDDLLALDVRAIAAPDALLFLWTTSAHLLDGTSPEVARSWGFEPKTTIAWCKLRPPRRDVGALLRTAYHHVVFPDHEPDSGDRIVRAALKSAMRELAGAHVGFLQRGFGHYVRGAHELVLVCRRGRARVQRRDVPSVFFAPRGAHSAKPEAFLGLVESLAAGPRVDLFARAPRAGWAAWGDQLGWAA